MGFLKTHPHLSDKINLREPQLGEDVLRSGHTPSLPELEAFVRCARLGSATQAAHELNLTQSAVSRSLASLEGRIGAQLFHRVRQRLELSDAGRALLHDAERILEDLSASALRVMAFGGRRDLLRVAVSPCLGESWLTPRLGGFARLAPETSFDVAARRRPVDFAHEPFDCALQTQAPEDARTQSLRLIEERLIPVASPRLAPPHDGALSDAALARLPLIQQAGRPELWLDWFAAAQTTADPTEIARGPRFEGAGLTLAAARAGLGAALVPEILAQEDLARGDLLRLSRRRLEGAQPCLLIWPERSEASPSFRLFRDWLLREAGRLPFEKGALKAAEAKTRAAEFADHLAGSPFTAPAGGR